MMNYRTQFNIHPMVGINRSPLMISNANAAANQAIYNQQCSNYDAGLQQGTNVKQMLNNCLAARPITADWITGFSVGFSGRLGQPSSITSNDYDDGFACGQSARNSLDKPNCPPNADWYRGYNDGMGNNVLLRLALPF